MLLVRGKHSFLHVDIWFDVTKCKFNVKDSSFEMLVVFSPIFVADSKITFVYNFVAPLSKTSVFTKSINMCMWVAGTSNQLFIRGS